MNKMTKWLKNGKVLLSLCLVAAFLIGMLPQIALAATDVTLNFQSGAGQDGNKRYLIWFDGLSDQSDIYWNNNTVYIDGNEVSGEGVNYTHISGKLALCLAYDVIESGVTTAGEFTGSHVLHIKKGTAMGNNGQYAVSNDVWLKLNQYEVSQLNPVTLSMVKYGNQDNLTRFAITFSGFADTANKYWNDNIVYIDGEAVTGDGVNYLPNDDDTIGLYLTYDKIESGVTEATKLGKHTLEIPAGTLLGGYVVAKTVTIQIDGYTLTQVVEPDVTVELSSDWRNENGGATTGLYFTVSPADELTSAEDWMTRYAMTTGGIYVNDTVVPGAKLVKVLDSLYYIAFDGTGVTFAQNDIVKVAGTVTSNGYTVKYEEAAFQYDGSGNWALYSAPAPVNFALDATDPGGWQSEMSRYLVWLSDDITGDKQELGNVQLLVDGETKTVATALIDGRYLLVLDTYMGIDTMGDHTVKITAGQTMGAYTAAQDVTIYLHADGTVNTVAPAAEPDVTLTLSSDSSRNLNGGNKGGFYFNADPGDDLPADVDSWTIRYVMTTGGIYLNDSIVSGAKLVKLTKTLYYVAFDGTGVTFAANDIVKIAGTVTSEGYTVAYAEHAFQYDGNGNWKDYSESVSTSVKFALDATDPGGWQAEQNRYLAWLSDDITGDKQELGSVQLLVDGETKTVATALIDGRYLLVLDTYMGIDTQGDHTVKITAGQAMGAYTAAQDVTIQLHADGTVTSGSESTSSAVNFKLDEANPGGWQGHLNRYLAWLSDDITGTKQELGNVDLLVDGETQSVETALIEGRYALVLNEYVGISQMGKHTIKITAGQAMGPYTAAADAVIVTQTDGGITTGDASKPMGNKFALDETDPGGWQDGMNRYLIWLSDNVTGDKQELGTVQIEIDRQTKSVETALIDGRYALLLNENCGITAKGNHTVKINADQAMGPYTAMIDSVFYTYADGGVGTAVPAFEPDVVVTIENDLQRNQLGTCKTGFYFTVTPGDELPVDVDNWTIRYSMTTGGIYVNGEAVPGAKLVKLTETLYYVAFDGTDVTFEKGDVVKITGTVTSEGYTVKYEEASFCYDGKGNWELGTYLRDLREQEYKIQDISELKLGISQFPLTADGQTRIGEAEQSTNIAISTKLKLVPGVTEVKFGFSKIGSMWDISEAGWQIGLLPQENRINMLHDMTTFVTMGNTDLSQEEYTLEFGTVDVHEFVNGVDKGLYGRKIFLKVNGEEVVSYIDTNLERTLGKELFVYVSKDGEGCELLSLTSTGVLMREVEPTVYDFYDISSAAEMIAKSNKTTCLGQTEKNTNFAVRMHLSTSVQAPEILIAIGKVDPENFWELEESGWQLWMRPASTQVFLAHGMSDWEVATHYDYSSEYTVEFGVKDQIIEKDGKYVSTYCRIQYVKIDGEEVAHWEDTDFNRTLGNYVLMYCSANAETKASTLYSTTTLPVEIVINGETVEETDLVKVSSKVVAGKPSNIDVELQVNLYNKVVLDSVSYNGEMIDYVTEADGKYTYTLPSPQKGDTLRVELTAKTLTTDEPEMIFDLFDLSGQATLHVPQSSPVSLGMMINDEGVAASSNSAIRYAITLPESFNHIPLTILGDNKGLWGNHGAMLEITPGQIHFCHTATTARLASFANTLFNTGSTVCIEFGVVKCYENGAYKYDRWYVKAGKTADDMELIGWYDSVERGTYGTHAVCYGVDFGGDYDMYSLKNTYAITDASAQESKDMLREYNGAAELYFPGRVEAGQSAQIRFFTKPGTALAKLTVGGADVTADVVITDAGAYSYTIENLQADISFSYEIAESDVRHSITVEADSELQVTLSENEVVTGGDVTVSILGNVGYIPVLTANGTDITSRLELDRKTGEWTVTLRSIRADTVLKATAQEKNYDIIVNIPSNGSYTLGGDIMDGKLPFGGRLELAVTPDKGCYIQSVTVNGEPVTVDSEGKAVIEAVYMDADSLNIELQIVASDAVAEAGGQSGNGNLIWFIAGGAVLVVLIVLAAVLLGKRKKNGKEG